MSRKLAIVRSALAIAAISFAGIAHAETIEFTPSTSNPNDSAVANTNAYGSDANVSVGYSAYTYNYPDGYGTLDGGTGAAIYSDNNTSLLTMTFAAAAGYTVTLDSFNLATYDGGSESVDISVTGDTSSYSVTGATPSTTTYTTYSPDVTGTLLTLTITNLYDVGLNTITYTETPLAVPEPPSAVLALTGGVSVFGFALRRRKRTS